MARPAYADDCSSLGDCWGWLIAAALVVAALVVLSAIFWEMWVAAAAIDGMLAAGAAEGGAAAVGLDAVEGAEAAEAGAEAEEVTQESTELERVLQKYRDLADDANWSGGKNNCVRIAQDIAQKIAGQEADYVETLVDEKGSTAALAEELGSSLSDSSFESIARTLTEAGPGTQGLVRVYTYEVINGELVTFGHAFNVVNDAGYIVYINAQPAVAAITTSGAEAAAASGYVIDYGVQFAPLFEIL